MFITKKKHDAAIAELKAAFAATLTEFAAEQRNTIANSVADAEVRIRGAAQELFEVALAADRSKRYDSSEPFVEIVSETFSEEGGVQLRLDWNAPFINYLKKNGFTGPTDEAIVDNWLISLSRERIAEGGSEYK